MSVDRPLALLGFLPAWDIERRRVDLSAVVRWTLQQIRLQGLPIVSLETIHHHADGEQARALPRIS